METLKSWCGEASGVILLFLPHPAHILSAVGTKQEGEGSAPEQGGAGKPAGPGDCCTCWGVTLR